MQQETWQQIGEGVWLKWFPLKVMGADFNRTVTAFTIRKGEVLVHSTGPFSEEDYSFLQSIGERIHFVDATCFHDSFTKRVLQAMTGADFYAPKGFPLKNDRLKPIEDLKPVLGDSIKMIPINGMPKVNEVAFHDGLNGILVIADLLFNFGPDASGWTRGFMRVLAGIKEYPGISRMYRALIRDKQVFQESIDQLRALEFECLIVGHGQPIFGNGREILDKTLAKYGF